MIKKYLGINYYNYKEDMMRLIEQYHAVFQERSSFCLGIDPTPQILKQWDLLDNIDGLKMFCKNILESLLIAPLALVKIQSAYFERFGPEGMEQAKLLTSNLQALGIKVMLDAKRVDIGSTMEAYADAYLSINGFYNFDAMTVIPYMGFGSLRPAMDIAIKNDKMIFVVLASSNPEGKEIQSAVTAYNNLSVAKYLATQIQKHNDSTKTANIGAVVGATINDPNDIIEQIPDSLILTPGIGFQGGDLSQVLSCFTNRHNIIPISARAILSKGPSVIALADSLRYHMDLCRLKK